MLRKYSFDVLISETRPDNATESESSDCEDDLAQIRHANLIAQSLLTPSSTEALGAWEVHTKVRLTYCNAIDIFSQFECVNGQHFSVFCFSRVSALEYFNNSAMY